MKICLLNAFVKLQHVAESRLNIITNCRNAREKKVGFITIFKLDAVIPNFSFIIFAVSLIPFNNQPFTWKCNIELI